MNIYHLYFYVPKSHLEQVKDAIFAAGAGRVGNYEKCSWQTQGEGQFQPLAGSKPFLGDIGKVEKVCEYKVETICEKKYLDAVIKILKTSHPYETPAFGIVQLENYL